MMIEMSYAVTCDNHEIQNRLALTLGDWADDLNRRLAAKGKALVTIDRAESRLIEGSVEVSRSLRKLFPDDQLDDGRLSTPIVLNGIQIEFPMCYDETQTLSLMFIQAKGAPYDGLGVHLWKPAPEKAARTYQSPEMAGIVNMLMGALDDDFDKPKGLRPDWIITQPSFLPRLEGKWLSQLLSALQCFDPNLYLEEDRGFLPSPQYPVEPATRFYVAMQTLADEYLKSIADDAADDEREPDSAG